MSSQNKEQLKQLQEMEDEINFLRDKNYHIQRINDKYREKVSQLVAAMHFKKQNQTNQFSFTTEEELETLVHRLRAHDIARSPSLPKNTKTKIIEKDTFKQSLTREDDDGLMHSKSSVSDENKIEEQQEKQQNLNDKKVNKKKELSTGGAKLSNLKNIATINAQRATILRLRTENQNLASLVDTLKLQLSTATKLNITLEKKFRALSSSLDRSQGSPLRRQNDMGKEGNLTSSQMMKKLKELKEDNEKLCSTIERNEKLHQEISHYKTLLKKQTEEVQIVRQRELNTIKKLNITKSDLLKLNETIRALGTALRLSKVREKRAVLAGSKLKSEQKFFSQEEKEQNSKFLTLVIEFFLNEILQHHNLMGENLINSYICKISHEYRINDKKEVQKSEENNFYKNINQQILINLVEDFATEMIQHYKLLGEHFLSSFIAHIILSGGFIGIENNKCENCNLVKDSIIKDNESLIDVISRITELRQDNIIKENENIIMYNNSEIINKNSINPNEIIKNEESEEVWVEHTVNLHYIKSQTPSNDSIPEFSNEDLKLNKEILVENSFLKGIQVNIPNFSTNTRIMVDASTATISPLQISLAAGRSLPISPLVANKTTETLSPLLISRAIGLSSPDEDSYIIPSSSTLLIHKEEI